MIQKDKSTFFVPDTAKQKEILTNKFSGLVEKFDDEFFKLSSNDNISVDNLYEILPYEKYQLTPNKILKINHKNDSIVEDLLETLETEQFILLLGAYGSGKTHISKKILSILYENSKVYYIKAFRLKEPEVDRMINYINKNENAPVYIIIDALDDIHFHEKDVKFDYLELLKKLTSTLINNLNIKVIVNSRDFFKDNYDDIREWFYIDLEYKYIPLYRIQYLEKTNHKKFVDNWLLKYTKLKNSNKEILNSSKIKSISSELLDATTIPLFLNLLAQLYYETDVKYKDLDIYKVYDYIIDKTINGKLDEEGKLGANVFRTSKTRYDNILKTIAAKIYTSAFDEAFELNKFKSEFNTNEHNYCVLKQQIFTNNVSCKTENESKDIDEEKFRINILNSYFFVETEKYCKFKDDNILFFLTSKIIVDLLTKLSKEEGKDEQIAIIREIGSYYLHPIFIDNTEGILRNYSKTNEKEIDTIYSALYSLIHNGLIININSVNTYLTFDYPCVLG